VLGYGEQPVVHGLDLAVQPGEVCALLGPNGSGKSTLVKGALGLARLFAGEIRLFGIPATGSRAAVRRAGLDRARLGYVPQQVPASGGLPVTVAETVASGRLARMHRLRRMRSSDRAAVRTSLERFGLAGLERAQVSRLSGGQQRRVLLARALAGDPEVLFLDEPLAGVDLDHQELLARSIGELVSEGRTVVVVLHELGPLAPLITRVVALRDGRVVYDGPGRAVDVHLHGSEDHVHDARPAGPALLPAPPALGG
jgi:zinc transport system ATP-binding protein